MMAQESRQESTNGRAAGEAVSVLLQVSRMIGGTLDLDAVLRSSMDAAAEALNAEACSVLMNRENPDTGELSFHLVDGPLTDGLREVRLPMDEQSIAGWVARHAEALLVPDAYEDPRFNRSYDTMTGFHTRSMIAVPLRAKGKDLGVIEFLNRRDGNPFDADDLALSQGVAHLIAVAIYTAEAHQARLRDERLATVGRTMAGMAHCIKNILNGLQAGSYMIDRHLVNAAAPAVGRGWDMVKRNMQFLSAIVLDMLSYSKDRKPICQPCSIHALCQDVVDLLTHQAKENGVRLFARPGDGIDEVSIDEAAMRRCLINLVGNAIDACGENGGEVCIETAPADAGRFVIRVRDNGCGMDQADQEKIFDPFFSTKGSKGTGLGLAVTKKIVEEHGGRIELRSDRGVGTEFALVLPIRPGDRNT